MPWLRCSVGLSLEIVCFASPSNYLTVLGVFWMVLYVLAPVSTTQALLRSPVGKGTTCWYSYLALGRENKIGTSLAS